jgi:hypothetical protein
MPAIHSRSQDARAGLDSFASIYQLLRSGPMKNNRAPIRPNKRSYKTLCSRSIYQFIASAAAQPRRMAGAVTNLGRPCSGLDGSPNSAETGAGPPQANRAPIPAPPRTTIAHQPKTTAIQVPSLTLVRQAYPIPASTSVQIVNRSSEVATA